MRLSEWTLLMRVIPLAFTASVGAQTFTTFDVAGSIVIVPLSINPSGAVTGYYNDANSASHGFVRDPQGNITSFDPTGSTVTLPYGINWVSP